MSLRHLEMITDSDTAIAPDLIASSSAPVFCCFLILTIASFGFFLSSMVQETPPRGSAHSDRFRFLRTKPSKRLEPKTVLFWNKFSGSYNFHENKTAFNSVFKMCPSSNCVPTKNRSLSTESAAVIFDMSEFKRSDIPRESLRKPWQFFVFAHSESVANRYLTPSYRHWSELDTQSGGFFNLSLSYRLDADIFSDAYVETYKPHVIRRPSNIFEDRPRDILWLVSHCKTSGQRETYVRELAKHIRIDQYGKCSGKTTARHRCPAKTCGSLVRKYKFYLALENSVCKDYVTEKVFTSLNNDLVPIVLGGADYNRFLPNKSFIDIEKFPRPKDLADYLKQLMQDSDLYQEYLSWKYEGNEIWKLPSWKLPSAAKT